MKRLTQAAIVGAVIAVLQAGKSAWSQRSEALHATGPLPRFEVATIKESDPKNPRPFVYLVPGEQSLVHRHGSAWSLVLQAYELQGARVIGAPEWATKTQYFVEGKTPPKVFARMHAMSPEERAAEESLMLQALLKDRMKLAVHFERREVDAYDLVLAGKGPPKFAKVKATTGFAGVGLGVSKDELRLQGTNASMGGLASALAALTKRFVNDKTGLQGRFSIDMAFSPEGTICGGADNTEQPARAPSLFSALKDMGLKLVPSKAEVEVVVIDHIEKPTEN